MKQLMEGLGLDIPKWEGPTICESFASAKPEPLGRLPVTDGKVSVKKEAKKEVKKEVKKGGTKKGRKRPTDEGQVNEEAVVSMKRERAESPAGIKEEK